MRSEVEGVDAAREISAIGTGRGLRSRRLMHELRGEEHSKELEGATVP